MFSCQVVSQTDMPGVSPSVFAGVLPATNEVLVQWIEKQARSYFSWVSPHATLDFIKNFEKFANTKLGDQRKIVQRAVGMVPGFCPKGWEQDFKSEPILLEDPCVICSTNQDDELCLICDACSSVMHTYCIMLNAVPPGAWICPWCEQGTSPPPKPGSKKRASVQAASILKKIKAQKEPVAREEAGAIDNSELITGGSDPPLPADSDHRDLTRCKGAEQDVTPNVKKRRSECPYENNPSKSAVGIRVDGSCFAEAKLFSFFNRIKQEYGFQAPDFYGEQDWYEGSTPFPLCPTD